MDSKFKNRNQGFAFVQLESSEQMEKLFHEFIEMRNPINKEKQLLRFEWSNLVKIFFFFSLEFFFVGLLFIYL